MSKQSEDYLDKLLNSVNGEEIEETEAEQNVFDLFEESNEPEQDVAASFDVSDLETGADTEDSFSFDDIFGELTAQAEKETGMVSRRVSRSEADFLMEFEAELEDENFDDLLKSFDDDSNSLPEEALGVDPFAMVDAPTFSETPAFEAEEAFDKAPAFEADAAFDEAPAFETEPADAEEPAFDVASLFTESSEEKAESALSDLFGASDEPAPEEEPVLAQEPTAMEDFFQDMFADAVSQTENTQSESTADSFSLGGVDLASLFDGEETPATTNDAASPLDMGDDAFASLFGDSEGGSSDAIDLGNMGEADLMSLLSGDGLGDIGDMLSQSEGVSEVPMDGMDAFAAFAEGEMAASAPEEQKKGKTKEKAAKDKKGGFLDKLSTILFGLDEDDEEPVAIGAKKAPSAGELSDENASILASLDEEESGKKKKGKKEKKPKKEKEAKPKKEKKPKKPKKEKVKKPVEVDNTPPLKKGPVLLIFVMVASLFALVMLGTNLVGYASAVSKAESFANNCEYALAYGELVGLEIKADDMELYNQVATLATVDSELNAYYIFLENDRPEEALDSLICAAGRCKINADNAEVYGCSGQLETMRKEVANELSEKYGMTFEDAIALYELEDRDEYTIALRAKMIELGIIVE